MLTHCQLGNCFSSARNLAVIHSIIITVFVPTANHNSYPLLFAVFARNGFPLPEANENLFGGRLA